MTVPAVRTAVIPAAGFGTRLMPASKAVPKEMFPVLDKPVLQYVVEEALACGMDRLVLVISEGKDAIRRHLENDARLEAFLAARGKSDILQKVRDIAGAAEVEYVIQPEQNGLADALLCAREAVGGEPFGVVLGDAIIVSPPGEPSGLSQLKAVYERTGQAVVALREAAGRPLPGALLTADGRDELKRMARERGYHVLTKPVKPASLRAFLTALR